MKDTIRKTYEQLPPTPENDCFLKKEVLPIIIYVNWHLKPNDIWNACYLQTEKIRCIVVCQYKVLFNWLLYCGLPIQSFV